MRSSTITRQTLKSRIRNTLRYYNCTLQHVDPIGNHNGGYYIVVDTDGVEQKQHGRGLQAIADSLKVLKAHEEFVDTLQCYQYAPESLIPDLGVCQLRKPKLKRSGWHYELVKD